MGKGLYEALYWLNKFITYFEKDYALVMEDNIIDEPEENLSEDDKIIRKE